MFVMCVYIYVCNFVLCLCVCVCVACPALCVVELVYVCVLVSWYFYLFSLLSHCLLTPLYLHLKIFDSPSSGSHCFREQRLIIVFTSNRHTIKSSPLVCFGHCHLKPVKPFTQLVILVHNTIAILTYPSLDSRESLLVKK